MGFFDLFDKKDINNKTISIMANIDIPKIEWGEFLKFIGYTDKDIKGNVEQLKILLSPFLVDLYKYRFNMPIDLNKRIDMFEDWFNNMKLRLDYCVDVRKLISKLACWYEMRYSDNILEEMLSSCKMDTFTCFDFSKNQYVCDNFSDESDVHYLELSKTLDFGFFIRSLSVREKNLFKKKRLGVRFITGNEGETYFLTPNGFVNSVSKDGIYDKLDRTKHITDVFDFSVDSIDVYINSTRERFRNSILNCYKSAFARQEILNCAMYMLILNRNTQFGTLRALLFAKEFGLDIDIPMAYGANRDNYIRQEINFYLKLGGSKDLICYRNYFDSGYQNGNEPLEMESISDMIKDYFGLYTKEEKFLQQKLYDILASQVSRSKELYQKLADILYSCIDQEKLVEAKKNIIVDEDAERRKQVIQKRLAKKLNR